MFGQNPKTTLISVLEQYPLKIADSSQIYIFYIAYQNYL